MAFFALEAFLKKKGQREFISILHLVIPWIKCHNELQL